MHGGHSHSRLEACSTSSDTTASDNLVSNSAPRNVARSKAEEQTSSSVATTAGVRSGCEGNVQTPILRKEVAKPASPHFGATNRSGLSVHSGLISKPSMAIHIQPPSIRPIKTPRGDPFECPHPKLRRCGETGGGTESPYPVSDARSKRDFGFGSATTSAASLQASASQPENPGKRVYRKSRLSWGQSGGPCQDGNPLLSERFIGSLKAGMTQPRPELLDFGSSKSIACSMLTCNVSRSSTPVKGNPGSPLGLRSSTSSGAGSPELPLLKGVASL